MSKCNYCTRWCVETTKRHFLCWLTYKGILLQRLRCLTMLECKTRAKASSTAIARRRRRLTCSAQEYCASGAESVHAPGAGLEADEGLPGELPGTGLEVGTELLGEVPGTGLEAGAGLLGEALGSGLEAGLPGEVPGTGLETGAGLAAGLADRLAAGVGLVEGTVVGVGLVEGVVPGGQRLQVAAQYPPFGAPATNIKRSPHLPYLACKSMGHVGTGVLTYIADHTFLRCIGLAITGPCVPIIRCSISVIRCSMSKCNYCTRWCVETTKPHFLCWLTCKGILLQRLRCLTLLECKKPEPKPVP